MNDVVGGRFQRVASLTIPKQWVAATPWLDVWLSSISRKDAEDLHANNIGQIQSGTPEAAKQRLRFGDGQ